MRTLRTFDVFDTVLTRRVGDPTSVFLAVGAELAARGLIGASSAEAFARARRQAERLAAALSETGHPMIDAIYTVLAEQLGMSPEVTAAAVDVECSVESDMVIPVPGIQRELASARVGGEVAFVSDMYLPGRFIRSLLERYDLIQASEALYVSGEVGLSKRRGDLFAHVLREHGRKASDVIHVGDDPVADAERPRSLGIVVKPLRTARLNRYEQSLEGYRWASQGMTSALAGSSRVARLATSAEDEHETALRDVTAGVAAPLLVSYVSWLLARARQRRLSRLYFVARDGEILLEIARELEAGRRDPLELRYLYGSRQAWYPASVDPAQPMAALRTLSETFDDTLASLLDRCGVDPLRWLPPAEERGRAMSLRSAMDELVARPGFLAEVTRGLCDRQERLLAYAGQEGLLERQPSGVVDLGWRGRSLAGLSQLVVAHGGARPVGIYLGLRADHSIRSVSEVWLNGFERRLRFAMVETFCAGTHGQVTDYVVGPSGAVTPLLRRADNSEAIEWGLGVVRSTMTQFARAFAASTARWPSTADARLAALDTFDLFYNTPTRSEARAWGSFPFEVGAMAQRPELLAPERSVGARIRAAVSGRPPARRWPAGDAALAPEWWQPLSRTGRRAVTAARHEIGAAGRRARSVANGSLPSA